MELSYALFTSVLYLLLSLELSIRERGGGNSSRPYTFIDWSTGRGHVYGCDAARRSVQEEAMGHAATASAIKTRWTPSNRIVAHVTKSYDLQMKPRFQSAQHYGRLRIPYMHEEPSDITKEIEREIYVESPAGDEEIRETTRNGISNKAGRVNSQLGLQQNETPVYATRLPNQGQHEAKADSGESMSSYVAADTKNVEYDKSLPREVKARKQAQPSAFTRDGGYSVIDLNHNYNGRKDVTKEEVSNDFKSEVPVPQKINKEMEDNANIDHQLAFEKTKPAPQARILDRNNIEKNYDKMNPAAMHPSGIQKKVTLKTTSHLENSDDDSKGTEANYEEKADKDKALAQKYQYLGALWKRIRYIEHKVEKLLEQQHHKH